MFPQSLNSPTPDYTTMAPRPAFTLCQHVKTRMERSHGVLCCQRCGRLIRVGQDVISISRNHKQGKAGYKMYHEPCFEAMRI
jgi:Fe2+ or Zn2+ uptake regulation protein